MRVQPFEARFFRFRLWTFSVMLSICAPLGCSPPGPVTGDLTGTVSNNGERVGDCRVRLLQPETRRYSGGKVNANGEFEVLKLPIGNYLMSVSQNPPKTLKDEPFDKRIPAKYRDEDTSGFAIEIKEGDNQIDLKMGE